MDFLTAFLPRGITSRTEPTLKKKVVNPLTYPKSSEPFNYDLFANPTSEYRGCPFWAWNNKLNEAQLLRQIDRFAEMGMGGFHMHVRTGLDTEYMGSEFMDIIRSCVEYAEKKKMMACLYDEDRWPSGGAGGKVITGNPEHKGKHILFTPHVYGSVDLGGIPNPNRAAGARSENGYLLASYDIELDETGCLKSARRLKDGEPATNKWYAYVETNQDSSWFNEHSYVDSLSPQAMAKFIEVTHEVYKEKVGDKFGSTIPCIFTDEPQFVTKVQLGHPTALQDVFWPWTTDLPETFQKKYSTDLVDNLPQIIWNLPGGAPSLTRYHYHDHVAERFVSAFMDQLARWCRNNNIMLDGHMMEEPTLWSQTTAIGEAMRCYRNMEMPGMDLLEDRVELNTAKQASSVARQNGIRGTMSEIYGATHWTLTFEAHKGGGDWQAALGITFRVQHLTWVSMVGEAKRDYPASIGYQSPWYKEYRYIEDHFARVGVAMTRGKAVTRVGVIHPIESCWLAFGPHDSGDELNSRDRAFGELTSWLLHGLIDFDFISESLLPNQVFGKITNKLNVGRCQYDVIILPNMKTIRSTTLEILGRFTKAGGKVIVAGSAPQFIDAQIPPRTPITISSAQNVHWSRQDIISALEPHRELRVLFKPTQPTDRLLYQMRQDGDERFVFICNTDRQSPVDTMVQLKGYWSVQKLDTLNGEESNVRSQHGHGWTGFSYRFEGCASLLVRLSPSSYNGECALSKTLAPAAPESVSDLVLKRIRLSEPNVLMLDYAEWKLENDSEWTGRTEVLRLDNAIRNRLQLGRRGGASKQPYTVPASERQTRANVMLRFNFQSYIDIDIESKLALENAANITITINDIPIPSIGSQTWWVDEDITTVTIPPGTITTGTNTILLEFPFQILTNIERMYLLGDFAVHLYGNRTVLESLDMGILSWGDITWQGLPFYVGNVIYDCSFEVSKDSKASILSVPDFSSTVLAVHDSKEEKIGNIAMQPRTLDLGQLKAGRHNISITAFGNRFNAFGHIHVPDGKTNGCWPDLWRTEGDWWTDEYKVRPIGVMKSPTVVSAHEALCEGRPSTELDWVVVEN